MKVWKLIVANYLIKHYTIYSVDKFAWFKKIRTITILQYTKYYIIIIK